MRSILSLIAIVAMAGYCTAQNEVLSWKDHFSYRNVRSVTSASNAIYAATEIGAFKIDLPDYSITRLNKTNKLSDTGISFLHGISEREMVIIGYDNGNIDVLIGERVVNLSDIKSSSIIASKGINEVLVIDNAAYLSTEFGIVKLDLDKLEINDTYLIGDNGSFVNVTDLELVSGKLVAATEQGIFEANVNNAFLSNFESWSQANDTPDPSGNYQNLEVYDGRLYAHLYTDTIEYIYSRDIAEGSEWSEFWSVDSEPIRDIRSHELGFLVTTKGKVYQYDESLTIQRTTSSLGPGWTDNYQSIMSPDGDGIWIANSRAGLFQDTKSIGSYERIPNGPDNSSARRIRSYFENVWSSTGGVSLGYANNFKKDGINFYLNNKWGSLTSRNSPLLAGTNGFGGVTFDMMDVAIDPEDNGHVYASSWDEGLFEIRNGEVVELYNTENSPLIGVKPEHDNKVVFIDGLTFDGDNNLWVTNSQTENCLHVKTPAGEWHTFNFAPDIGAATNLGDIVIDEGNDRGDYIWVILPNGRGILVFDYNGTLGDTSDDRYKILTSEEGNGGLPTDDVYSIARDVNGEMWIGTLQGIAVFYNTDCLFTEDECDAQQILIEQDGNFQLLLETETITSIEIDGGNRKWIGTQTSGVYLLSNDGIDQVYRFTKDNSPLLSDNIQDISFNFTTGEVFFATDLGIVSFIGTATGFDGSISDTKIYPNPVREDYSGYITVDGLTFNTDVRITDINGNLVHTTTSEGGRAIWDGTNETGQRVSTGVYLVFASNSTGKETTVGKIAVIN